MKLGVISDLHIDDNPEGVLEALIAKAKASRGLDCLVIPGDISSAWRTSLGILDRIEAECGLPVFFVPGNHDLWNREHPEESPEDAVAAFAERPGCLSGKIVRIGEWSLIGETGWYDESFAEGRFDLVELEPMSYGGRTWQDAKYTRWGLSIAEKNREYLEKLESRLAAVDPSRTVVVTHMVPRIEFTVQPPRDIWLYFNALLGSASYGELFTRYGVRAALFGHVHYRKRATIDGVEWICSCLGNANEWRAPSLESELDLSFAELDL
jgi:putative phosphoesterase